MINKWFHNLYTMQSNHEGYILPFKGNYISTQVKSMNETNIWIMLLKLSLNGNQNKYNLRITIESWREIPNPALMFEMPQKCLRKKLYFQLKMII